MYKTTHADYELNKDPVPDPISPEKIKGYFWEMVGSSTTLTPNISDNIFAYPKVTLYWFWKRYPR